MTKRQIEKFNKSRINDADEAFDYYINNDLHVIAIALNEEFKLALLKASLTAKERNADKRSATQKKLSTFCKSAKETSQAFRIDEALKEYHTMKELQLLDTLDDCKESRIKSHVSFLIHNFKHTCKLVIHNEDVNKMQHLQRFKFELI
jgi:hypothetical protein